MDVYQSVLAFLNAASIVHIAHKIAIELKYIDKIWKKNFSKSRPRLTFPMYLAQVLSRWLNEDGSSKIYLS